MNFFRLSMLIMLLCLLFGIILLSSPPTIYAQSVDVNCTALNTALLGGTGGTFGLTEDCELDQEYTITATVTINGNGYTIYAPNYNSGTGHGNARHFTVNSSGDLTLNNLTLTGGYAPPDSGGAIVNDGTLTVTNSTFSDNEAASFPPSSNIRSGGALYNTGTATIADSTFSGNYSAGLGGAINNGEYGNTGTATITGSTFSGNESIFDGGAILNNYGTATITDSTFSGNYSKNGGGALSNNGTANVTNSTFSGNTTDMDGGAITNYVTINITNSIIANSPSGGNCDRIRGTMNFTGMNIIDDTTCTSDTTVWTNADPLLAALADNGGPTQTMAIDSTSPAYDAALNCTVTADQRGVSRDALCDVGAFELQTYILTVNKTGNGTGTVSDGADINCGPTCTDKFPISSTVTLTATADTDSTFTGWGGAGASCGTAATCNVTMDAAKTVTAVFEDISTASEDNSTAEASSGPEWGEPFPCDAMVFVGGWGIYSEGTPEQTAFTIPDPPAGYSYAAQPRHTGWCDMFTVSNDHSPLPVTVCWPATGATAVGLYHDIPNDPDHGRTWAIIPTTQQGTSVCATLPAFGGVALLAGGAPTDTMVEAPAPTDSAAVVNPPEATVPTLLCAASALELGGVDAQGNFVPVAATLPVIQQEGRTCVSLAATAALTTPAQPPATTNAVQLASMAGDCPLTTTNIVNFRETPDGAVIGRVPYNTPLNILAEANGWYQVEWLGQQGWISADYVTAVCE